MSDLATFLNQGSILFALLGLTVAGIRYAKSRQFGDEVKVPLVFGLMLASMLQIANMLTGPSLPPG